MSPLIFSKWWLKFCKGFPWYIFEKYYVIFKIRVRVTLCKMFHFWYNSQKIVKVPLVFFFGIWSEGVLSVAISLIFEMSKFAFFVKSLQSYMRHLGRLVTHFASDKHVKHLFEKRIFNLKKHFLAIGDEKSWKWNFSWTS